MIHAENENAIEKNNKKRTLNALNLSPTIRGTTTTTKGITTTSATSRFKSHLKHIYLFIYRFVYVFVMCVSVSVSVYMIL